jgi:hypothetical protein
LPHDSQPTHAHDDREQVNKAREAAEALFSPNRPGERAEPPTSVPIAPSQIEQLAVRTPRIFCHPLGDARDRAGDHKRAYISSLFGISKRGRSESDQICELRALEAPKALWSGCSALRQSQRVPQIAVSGRWKAMRRGACYFLVRYLKLAHLRPRAFRRADPRNRPRDFLLTISLRSVSLQTLEMHHEISVAMISFAYRP